MTIRTTAQALFVSPLQPSERLLYDEVASFVREQLHREGKGAFNRMALLTLHMALGSSCRAAAGTPCAG